MALKINKENVVYGLENVLQNVAPQPIKSKREATTADRAAIGTTWINQTNDSYAVLTNIAANQSTWQKYPTGSGPFNLNSETIRLHATDAGDPTAILIEANAAGSGVNIYGHDNVDILSTANVNVNAGAGTINIGNVPLLPIANTINIGNALSHVNINGGPASIIMTTDNGEISLSTGTGAINIGTDAAKTITMGNVIGATGLVLNSGTGNVAVSSTDSVTIDSAGVLELNSSAGIIGIGNDVVNQNINLGTGGARTITIGNGTGVTSVEVNVGTGALNLGATATAHATTVGSTTAGSTLILNTPTATPVAIAEGVSVTTSGAGITLPGPVNITTGAGVPAAGLALHIGDLYIRTDAGAAAERMYIATGVGTWTNVSCAA